MPEQASERSGPWQSDEPAGDFGAVNPGPAGHVPEAERRLPERPSIWIGSLLDYTNGVLHGAWLDAAQELEALRTGVQAILAASPTTKQTGETAEEWAIFDSDGFGSVLLSEYADLSWVSAVACGITQHGPAFAAYADVVQDEAALAGFQDDYLGQYDSVEDYVEEMADDSEYNRLLDAALPECIRGYVRLDTATIARDMYANGDIHVLPAASGGVWLFTAY